MSEREAIVVVGAGLSGLCAALRLGQAGHPCRVIDAGDGVGGRLRSDRVNGFILDRGFAVLNDAYPEAQRVLDLPRLDLQRFDAGARIRVGDSFQSLFDPRRHPSSLLSAALTPVMSWSDKVKAMRLWNQTRHGPATDLLLNGNDQSTEQELVDLGFSQTAIDTFFRPFFGGVFLQQQLSTSSRFFRFCYRMFAQGRATLPARGMQAIAEQLAERARAHGTTFELKQAVMQIQGKELNLSSGDTLEADAIVLAVEQEQASRLLGIPPVQPGPWRGTRCMYFAADEPPVRGRSLVLNGNGPADGPVNHLAVLSEVARGYAPLGQALISATLIEPVEESPDAPVENRVREQLYRWFGSDVRKWRHLRTYLVPQALPPYPQAVIGNLRPRQGIYLCGDYLRNPSIQGAMESGRLAAETLLADLR